MATVPIAQQTGVYCLQSCTITGSEAGISAPGLVAISISAGQGEEPYTCGILSTADQPRAPGAAKVTPCVPTTLFFTPVSAGVYVTIGPDRLLTATSLSSTAARATSSSPTTALLNTSTASQSGSGAAFSTSATNVAKVSSTASISATSKIPSSNDDSHKNSVSDGAAAGIAIGCLLAGMLLSGLIFAFLLRRQKNRRGPSSGYTHHPRLDSTEKHSTDGRPGNLIALKGGAVSYTDSLLPQPDDDNTLTGQFSSLRDSIKNHAQNYYHVAPVDSRILEIARLEDFAKATSISASTIRGLLIDPESRIAAIRMYLGWVVLSRCGGQGDTEPSLLPPEVAIFVASLEDSNSTSQSSALITKWKSISGVLLQPFYKPTAASLSKTDPRNNSIAQALPVISGVLDPFAGADCQRIRNLDQLMRKAVQFAFLLFAQPSLWRFDWTSYGVAMTKGSIPVFPSLVQTVDEQARILLPSRELSEMEVVVLKNPM